MRAVALAAFLLAGCATSDVVAVGPCRGPSDCTSGVCEDGLCAPSTLDASIDAGDGGFCEGAGPLVLIGDSTGDVLCAGDVAQTTFRYALCTCETLSLSSALVTDAFDSRQGPYTTGQGGASVGVNASLDASGTVGVAGALTVAGLGGITLGPSSGLVVRGDLSSGGPVGSAAPVSVLSDARVDGSVTASALTVAGTLTIPEALTIDVAPGPLSVGATVRETVDVAAPCDCAPERRLDVGALTAARAMDNDDASIGLVADAFVALGTSSARTLPCGRYYLDGISTGAGVDVTLEATGRVALFIDGDVVALGNLTFVLGQDAELDVFVAGDVRVDGRFVIGDPTRAARTRIYIGGTQSIALSADASIAANLYAPGAALQTSAALEVFGSLFTERLAASASVMLHYDRAVLGAATTCVLPTSCQSCLECQNQACSAGGVCGACTTTSDCCAPLECIEGVCGVEIL